MAWVSLGTKTPMGNVWQVYQTTTSSELFKLSHVWEVSTTWKPRALIAQAWGTTEVLVYPQRIYPRNRIDELIEMPCPQAYKDAGLGDRDIAIMLLTPYIPEFAPYAWTVQLSAFEPNI